MSWFSDIAGRAEDFLTKVDQKAASALQKPLLPNATKNSFMAYAKSPTTRAAPPSEFPAAPPPLSTKFTSTPKPPSRGLSLAGSSSSPKPKRAQSEASDEKLLEFLNSSEPAPAAPKRSLSQSKLAPEAPNDADDAAGGSDSSSRKELDERAAPEACIAEEGASVSSATDHDGPGSRRASLQQESLQGAAAASGRSMAADTAESGLAEENKMLRKEVATLNQEIASALQRAKNADAEKKHLQNRLDLWTSQVSSSDSALRELQARERDLTSALEAKDRKSVV